MSLRVLSPFIDPEGFQEWDGINWFNSVNILCKKFFWDENSCDHTMDAGDEITNWAISEAEKVNFLVPIDKVLGLGPE